MTRAARLLAALTATALLSGTAALAQDANPAIAARKAHMDLYGFNLGILGGMARGNVPYDAELASTAASNLAGLTALDIAYYFPEGTSTADTPDSRALPAIWENLPDVVAKAEALSTAAAGLADVAGNGVEALQAGLGPVGQACGACHQSYRQPDS